MIEYIAIFIAGCLFTFAVMIFMDKFIAFEDLCVQEEINQELRTQLAEKDQQIKMLKDINDFNMKKVFELKADLEKAERNEARQPKGARDENGNPIGGRYASRKAAK